MQFDCRKKRTKGKKMSTLAECGNVPDPSKSFAAGDTWSWFMVWYTLKNGSIQLNDPSDSNFNKNTAAYWNQIMSDSHVMNRDAMPSLK